MDGQKRLLSYATTVEQEFTEHLRIDPAGKDGTSTKLWKFQKSIPLLYDVPGKAGEVLAYGFR